VEIDTNTIRRLRDALLTSGQAKQSPMDGPAGAARIESMSQASEHRVSPFVETMYLMMTSDGEMDATEYDVIRGALKVLTHGLLDESALERILTNCETQAREQGVEARLQAVGSRICGNRADRETAFTLAAAVALADDRLLDEELRLVGSIAEWYGISERRCAQILQQFESDQ
jgi:uncharacterized tellurite resistance protein B-like protein